MSNFVSIICLGRIKLRLPIIDFERGLYAQIAKPHFSNVSELMSVFMTSTP